MPTEQQTPSQKDQDDGTPIAFYLFIGVMVVGFLLMIIYAIFG